MPEDETAPRATTRLTVIGSGDAFSGCGCNSAYLVDGRVLVDCGAPVHAMLPRAGISPVDIDLVLLTHFHADHTYMLPMLLGARAFGGEVRPGLVIGGPPGTAEFVRRMLHTGYGAHLVNLIEERVQPQWLVLQDSACVEVAGSTVSAHAVLHSTGPSLAYTVRCGDGPRVGFSGDSALCAGLRRTIAGSDVMVCECTGWTAPAEGGHLWRAEVEQLIAENPATRFVLSHLHRRGPVDGAVIAHDLLTLDLAAG